VRFFCVWLARRCVRRRPLEVPQCVAADVQLEEGCVVEHLPYPGSAAPRGQE
jgi:hypothetical protein